MNKMVLVIAAVVFAGTIEAPLRAQDTGITTAAPPSVPSAKSGDIAKENLLGRDAYSQDQTLMGPVERVATASDGRVSTIFIRTGGFLGFGARLVAIPEGKFHMRGRNVQLQLTSEDVQKLPEAKDGS